MKKILSILCFASLLWACTSDSSDGSGSDDDNPAPVSFQRGPMLVNWADNIIIPSYEAFAIDMANLNASFDTFKADASTVNLTAFRASWLTAYKTWQKVSLFEIGPAENVGFRLNMNIYPTDADKIESHIASGTYDLSLSSNRDAKGFPALDYLINGLGETDDAIVSKYNTTGKDALLAYTEAVLGDMTALSSDVLSQWKSSYRDTFVANDGSSATSSVDRFVNDYIFYYEKFLRAGKMGIPLGVFSGSALPEKVEGYYKADVSNELFLEGLAAVQDFFNGKHFGKSEIGESLASYLDDLNTVKDGEDLNQLINDQFNSARTMVADLSPFRTEIENNTPPTNMFMAYDEVQRAVPLLKVDMVSAMSISIDFVDADGD
ncbi:imelysin family protein [Costertonia aggregata]|uniref:Imelysin family protein n=1 Tax=Costertonia aggregata TaxID=343403 RepID=A0A7H9ASB3_9FLAO|nr:imelysin family protein [Costertonia aggregata]QLG46297.1 imelysin family protein [Costertonia aggregata]